MSGSCSKARSVRLNTLISNNPTSGKCRNEKISPGNCSWRFLRILRSPHLGILPGALLYLPPCRDAQVPPEGRSSASCAHGTCPSMGGARCRKRPPSMAVACGRDKDFSPRFREGRNDKGLSSRTIVRDPGFERTFHDKVPIGFSGIIIVRRIKLIANDNHSH